MSTGICHGMRLQVCQRSSASRHIQFLLKAVENLVHMLGSPSQQQTTRCRVLQCRSTSPITAKPFGLSFKCTSYTSSRLDCRQVFESVKLAVASPTLDLALAVSYRSRKAWPKMKSSPDLPLLLKLTSNKSEKSSLGQS